MRASLTVSMGAGLALSKPRPTPPGSQQAPTHTTWLLSKPRPTPPGSQQAPTHTTWLSASPDPHHIGIHEGIKCQ